MTSTSSVRPQDPDYPGLLRTISDPPEVLYRLGTMVPDADAVAFVGSRSPTAYGRRMTRLLAADAARAGLVVVSGLARGIDSEAHAAALASGGTTWAVLGCGLDRVYPPENQGLARRIVEAGGCLLSEFPAGTPPLANHFPSRNRIIAGLSWVTVVVEGRLRSGSLITARLAAGQGREVMAVPGPADSELSAAPHLLLREGVRPMTCIKDLLEELPPECRARTLYPTSFSNPVGSPERAGKEASLLDEREGSVPMLEKRRIMDLLGPSGITLEELVIETGLDFSQVSHIIFHLELEGLVRPMEGQRYARL